MALYGVRIMNEGQVMSTNDIYIENTYQFVASDIELMDSLNAYQTGESRHKYVVISRTGEYVESSSEINPIDKEAENEVEQPSEVTNADQLVLSDSDLEQLSKEEALEELKRRWLILQDYLLFLFQLKIYRLF